MAQSERNSHSKNRGGKNYIDNQVLYQENISFAEEAALSPLSTRNELKYENEHNVQTAQKSTPKHFKQLEPQHNRL